MKYYSLLITLLSLQSLVSIDLYQNMCNNCIAENCVTEYNNTLGKHTDPMDIYGDSKMHIIKSQEELDNLICDLTTLLINTVLDSDTADRNLYDLFRVFYTVYTQILNDNDVRIVFVFCDKCSYNHSFIQ